MNESPNGDESNRETVSWSNRDGTENTQIDCRRGDGSGKRWWSGGVDDVGRRREDRLGRSGVGEIGRSEGGVGGGRDFGGDGERVGDSATEGLDDVSLTQVLRCDDVAESTGLLVSDEGDVGTSSGVVLDRHDLLLALLLPDEIDDTQSSLVTSSTRSDGDSTGIVSTTGCSFPNRERAMGLSLVEVFDDGLTELSEGGRDGEKGFEGGETGFGLKGEHSRRARIDRFHELRDLGFLQYCARGRKGARGRRAEEFERSEHRIWKIANNQRASFRVAHRSSPYCSAWPGVLCEGTMRYEANR